MPDTNVAVIGAGPYGLSIATHLRHRGIEFRIFGEPMDAWTRMPAGMRLKSLGLATNISAPNGQLTLEEFARGRGLEYHDVKLAIPLSDFLSYGLHFQQRLVPEVERSTVVAVNRTSRDYLIRLATGEAFRARRVIVATGLSGFKYLPQVLRELPDELLSHTSQHHELARFDGRSVAVIGGGASALDHAVLLREAGARVTIVARRPIVIGTPPTEGGPLWHRLRCPQSKLGHGAGGWGLWFCSEAPHLFRWLPATARARIVQTYLGPAGGWDLQGRVLGRIPIRYGTIRRAAIESGRARLRISGDGEEQEILADHVIAGTGYRVDLKRLPFLEDLAPRIGPKLSADFETSLPGLYLAGILALNTFGPLMRFVCGTEFAGPRLARHLGQSGRRERP